MKLLDQVLDSYICKMVNIDEMQFSFVPGKGTTDTIFVVFQLQEYIAANKLVYFAFVDLGKAFDCVSRKVLWWALESLRVMEWAVCHSGHVLQCSESCTGHWSPQEECISKLNAWKTGMESKGLLISMKKTRFLVSGPGQDVLKKFGKCSSAVYCRGVINNSIQCSQCMLWAHKECSGITKWLRANQIYVCSRCEGETWPIDGRTVTKVDLTAPCLMRKPLSATLVICCVLVGAVTVPLLPDVVWHEGSSRNICLSWPQDTSHLGYAARCARPAFAGLCSMV